MLVSQDDKKVGIKLIVPDDKRIVVAFVCAILFHFGLMLVPTNFNSQVRLLPEREDLSVNIVSAVEKTETQADDTETTEKEAQQETIEKPTQEPKLESESQVRQAQNQTEAEQELAIDVRPNITSASISSDTFVAPAPITRRNTKHPSGPLDGGAYKVVKNGVECVQLQMAPQTLDQVTGKYGAISGSGRCKKLNRPIELLDKDGKIKNSDRWKN